MMAIYAISDLHLSFGTNKPMSVFGENWGNHFDKISKDWIEKVEPQDVVILAGDFSWATYLEDTFKDFEYLNSLPGKKLLLKGNHDYWWTTLTSMRKYLKENNFCNIDFLQNNSYKHESHIIVGTRGWQFTENAEDKKILKREIARLELSISDGLKKITNNEKLIACIHYPPFNDNLSDDFSFINVLKKYPVDTCVYGHLHGASHQNAVQGNIDGIDFKLISCDYTDFKLIQIA
jgi:predicted phosphohydrolase